MVRKSEGVIRVPKPSSFLPRHECRVASQQGQRPVKMGTLSYSEGTVMSLIAEATLVSHAGNHWGLIKLRVLYKPKCTPATASAIAPNDTIVG